MTLCRQLGTTGSVARSACTLPRISNPSADRPLNDQQGMPFRLSATLTLGDVLSLGLRLAENFRRNPRARDPCSRDFRTITCLREAPFTPQ